MNIHEFQAKQILRKYGIKAPDYAVISSLDELKGILHDKEIEQAVLKVQVHAGGRGKAGGVKIGKNKEEILQHAKALLGMRIINNQTGAHGIVCSKLLLSPLADVKKEYYIGAVIDRKNAQATLIASPEGGMDIEEIAEKHPKKILKLPILSDGTIRSYNLLRLIKFMGWDDASLAQQGKQVAIALAKAFVETDASLIEINPLVLTNQNEIIALDAKLSVDENALYRQPQIAAFYDPTQMTPEEVKAKEFDLAYVALDGTIGCMVNGAGLAMATMDLIHLAGGSPANFLDVGGGASEEKVAAGFKIILADKKVKAILVNIFGGIMNCETLAHGIVSAAKELKVLVPLVVRMEGTNVDQGKKILADSGLNIILATDLNDAAKKVVAFDTEKKKRS